LKKWLAIYAAARGPGNSGCISDVSNISYVQILNSVRREVLYNILIEFDIPMKLVRLIKKSFWSGLMRRQCSSLRHLRHKSV
jgi:hypothetical protein